MTATDVRGNYILVRDSRSVYQIAEVLHEAPTGGAWRIELHTGPESQAFTGQRKVFEIANQALQYAPALSKDEAGQQIERWEAARRMASEHGQFYNGVVLSYSPAHMAQHGRAMERDMAAASSPREMRHSARLRGMEQGL